MILKRTIFVTAVLLGAAAVMLLLGCINPVAPDQEAAAQVFPLDQQSLGHDTKDINNGFFYQIWDNNNGSPTLSYTNGSAGNYTLQWNGTASNWNFVCGKGWGTWNGKSSSNAASLNKVVEYSGSFNPNTKGSDYVNSYLDFYGWANNFDVEYYILESYGEYEPSKDSSYTYKGQYTSNGATYKTYYKRQSQQPSPKGSGNYDFDQLYSIRTPRVAPGNVSGKIVLSDHISQWKTYGYNLTSCQFQVMATEGYGAVGGNSNITVKEGTTGVIVPDLPTTPSGYPETRVALKARYNNLYFTVQSGGLLNSNSSSRGTAQTFYMVALGNGHVAFRSAYTGRYVCAENGGSSQAVANRTWIDRWETFDFIAPSVVPNGISLKNNATQGDGNRIGWYLRFDGQCQQYVGTGCIFYIEYL